MLPGRGAHAQSAPDHTRGPTPDEAAADPAAEYTGDPDATGARPADQAVEEGDETTADPGKGGNDRQKKDRDMDIRGRVFVRNTIDSNGWTSVLGLDSARLGARYRDRKRGLQIEVEAELGGGRGELRDGYIRFEATDSVRVKAGRFKRPISAVALSSKWDLPVLERGIVSDLELITPNSEEPDRLPMGGRATGIAVELRELDLPFDPRFTVGVFRSDVHEQLAEASLPMNRVPLSLSDGFHEDVFARVELEPLAGLEVGASVAGIGYLSTAATPDTFRFGIVGGVDAIYEREPVRLWVEGYVGKSTLHFGTSLHARGLFVAARAIAAVHLRSPLSWLRHVEPYAAVQYLDASTEFNNDRARQLGGGVNAALSKSYRVGLAVDYVDGDVNLIGQGTRLMAQLGAVF